MTANLEMSCASNDDFATVPRDESGDFLLQDFDNPVASREPMYEDETRRANIRKERIFMQDGTYYEVTSTLAKQRTIDVGIVATAAWLTHDQGLNKDRALRAARLGIDTVFISPQQNLNRIGHFGKDVCNIIRIADELHTGDDRNPDKLWVDGVSQGIMKGLGVVAKAPYIDDKKVVVLDGTVPCFPDGISARRDLPLLPKLLKNESGAATAFIKLPLAALMHYPRTVSFSPKMQFQHLKQVPALLSGAVGDAARNMPDDTFGHITNYLGDIMGQGSRWEPILAQYDNITVEYYKGGGHLSLIDTRCQDKWERRMQAVHEILESEPKIVELGGLAIAEAVRSISPAHAHRPIMAA